MRRPTDESTFGAIRVFPEPRGRDRVVELIRGVLESEAQTIASHRSGFATEVIDLSVDPRSDGLWVELEMIAGARASDYVVLVRAIATALESEGLGHEVEGADWLEAMVNGAGE